MNTHSSSLIPVFETDESRSYFLIRLAVHDGFIINTLNVGPVTEQVIRLLAAVAHEPLSAKALLEALSLNHRPTFNQNYLRPALNLGVIEMTQPGSRNSPTQKYRLTDLGKHLLADKDSRQ